MWVFYILLLLPLAIQHFTVEGHSIDYKKRNQSALFIFFMIMTVLVALRHESVGNDTRNYIYYYELFSKTSWGQLANSDTELGYVILNKLVSLFTKESQVLFAVVAVVTTAMIYPTYNRLCVDTSLTIVLYVFMSTFVMMFSGIRQMLAVGIGFFAYECTRNKRLIPFVLCVVLAIMFHTSALMLVFMYPMYHAKITKKWLFVVVPAMALVFVNNEQVFSVLGAFLSRFTTYDPSITQTGAFTTLILFVVFVVFAFLIPEESDLDAETIGIRNFLLLSVVLQMFAPLNFIAMRMNYYYIIFIPLLLPKIIEARSTRWEQVAVVGRHVMVLFFLAYFFYNAYVSESNLHVFPYHFFWESV